AGLLAEQLQIPADQRTAFLKAARAELAADQLATPLPPPASPIVPTPQLPIGTVTFLFTDIAGSTHLWERHRDRMLAALARHDAIVREAIMAHGGNVFKMVGDAVCAVFTSAPQALAAALAAQRTLQAEPWQSLALVDAPQSKIQHPKSKIAVRMALHTG